MTYSIVARDPTTGQLGVAVQSHFFAVGCVVPWARPGVGAVATQSIVRIDYGPRGLDLMAGGASAGEALHTLVGQDPGAASRQVAMLDVRGGVAAVTGELSIAHAGDVQGDEVSCQANIMAADTVPASMLDAFMWESGPLAHRLLAALQAAEADGGDLRGRQSAALLVVPGTGEPWETAVSLRVEDSPEPLVELGRLMRLQSAFAAVTDADGAAAIGDHAAAADGYRRAAELAPESDELRFWAALARAGAGEQEHAVAELAALGPEWTELLQRLPEELAPGARALADLIKRG